MNAATQDMLDKLAARLGILPCRRDAATREAWEHRVWAAERTGTAFDDAHRLAVAEANRYAIAPSP